MASILNDNVDLNPTLVEAGCKVTVVLMAHSAYNYLHSAKWPGCIKDYISAGGTMISLKDFQKHMSMFECQFREKISELHIDNFETELITFLNGCFGDIKVTSTPESPNLYYGYDYKDRIVIIVSVNTSVA